MIKQLIKWFVKDYNETSNPMVRERYGRLAGIVGIISNVFLFALKIFVGTVFSSISITADAVNNLSDAGSSIITLVGFKLSSKPADEKHPYGHARAEYITGFLISVVILLLGLELIKSSFQKILSPDPIKFSYITVIILTIAVFLKLWQSLFNKTLGKHINSTALAATATDSRNDAIATVSVLAATLFGHFSGIQIDGYMGAAVALIILYSGFKLVNETLNPLLGVAPDRNMVDEIEKEILGYQGVLGLHDLVVHSYGPDKSFASVHVEVSAHGDLLESHDLIDTIERDILKKTNIHLVIHLDPIVTDDEMINILMQQVKGIIAEIDPKVKMHDFRVVIGKTHSNLIFDVVVPTPYKVCDDELRNRIQSAISKINPTYHSVITVDRNYTSTTNSQLSN